MRDVIIALDFSSKQETMEFLRKFSTQKPYVKIGMELYYAEGPSIIEEIKNLGHPIFLDLKLHDIPNTVYKAMKNIGRLKVDMTNVHAAGSKEMMRMAKKGLMETNPSTKLLAITQLTSITQDVMHSELLINYPINTTIVKYAKNAHHAGLDGVVCSPLEAKIIKEATAEEFLTVTPGIRFANSAQDDQKRKATPAEAKQLQADYIVVGRPITQASDPVAAYEQCVKEFC